MEDNIPKGFNDNGESTERKPRIVTKASMRKALEEADKRENEKKATYEFYKYRNENLILDK